MKIAIIGGTGDIGEGLALRLAQKHQIIIGSREAGKAKEAADNYNKVLRERGVKSDVDGKANEEAAKGVDVIIMAVKYNFAVPTLESIAGSLKDQIVITPIVPMTKTKLCAYVPPEEGSASMRICSVIPHTIKLVSSFHSLPAPRLTDLDDPLGFDVVVCADDEGAKKVVMKLAEDIGGIRALDGGTLEEAKLIEALTPLLINLAIKNKTKPLSIKFV